MRFRRHQPQSFELQWRGWFRSLRGIGHLWNSQTDRRRRLIVGGSAFVAMFLFGYAFAAIFFFPAPIFQRNQDVPRIIGLSLADAHEAIEEALLVASDTDVVSHPKAPYGQVVWQDPPPNVAAPRGSGVALWVSRGPRPVPVPDVSGYEQALAVGLIEATGLRVARIDTSVAPQERGVVVNTRPPAGQSLVPGEGVILFVSVGAPTIVVPELSGFSLEEAREALEELGLVLGSTRTRRTPGGAPGLIVGQEPAAGTLSAPGASVNVIVIRGERL
jgi:serine/threonine-protein kinase